VTNPDIQLSQDILPYGGRACIYNDGYELSCLQFLPGLERGFGVEFEWDAAKCLANIAKHGIDFASANTLFVGAHIVGLAKDVDGELRWLAVGTIGEIYVTAIFTRRGATVRIISMRRARNGERRRHREVFGH